MPCFEINEISLNLDNMDEDTLLGAMKLLGWEINKYGEEYNITLPNGRNAYFKNGKLTLDERDVDQTRTLKQAYSVQAVKTAAKKFGWNIGKSKKKNQLTLTRRY